MEAKAIYDLCRDKFGEEAVLEFNDGTGGDKDPWFEVEPYSIEEVCAFLKTNPETHMDYLESLCGTDYPDDEQIHVVYHLYSYTLKHRIVLKCKLDREDPALPTVNDVWRAADWQERECFDLLGVLFDGHPDLRRLLMPDDWEGHPMRKDYEEPDDYHGIPTIRPNPVELFSIKLPEKKADDEEKSAEA